MGEGSSRGSGRIRLLVSNRGSGQTFGQQSRVGSDFWSAIAGRVGSTFCRVGSGRVQEKLPVDNSAIWDTAEIPKPPWSLEFGWLVLGDSRWPILSPLDISLSNDNLIRIISCSWYATCRSFQCSCPKAKLCCTKVCWCEGDMKCVNPSTISAHVPDIE